MLFDEWPERYDQWFNTSIGKLVKKYESELIHKLLCPLAGESILDAGCGTGVFTLDFLHKGSHVVGLDTSQPMLSRAVDKAAGYSFFAVQGDMLSLPFSDRAFHKVVSITALEFISDAQKSVDEMFRVVRPGGRIVLATLNSLSPWATRRRAKTQRGQKHILENAYFRSPDDLLALSPLRGEVETAIHFPKDDAPDRATETEQIGRSRRLKTGAFVAVAWQQPW